MIRAARTEELDAIMGIYADARAFMASNGNSAQWANGYPRRDMIEEDLARGQLYVYETEEGEIGGVFVFFTGEEPAYQNIWDGNWLNDKPYGTLHRIAVSRHGEGIASKCVQWCYEQCLNMRGDTHEKNLSMQRLFAKNGFVRCGLIMAEDGTERIAYQKTAY
ncbi:MAG: GNAT family N-acetyltransferase [Eubacteriales bacterium]|nr:GNAT family N-acetyltransferase [Eubacteriales bacterium]